MIAIDLLMPSKDAPRPHLWGTLHTQGHKDLSSFTRLCDITRSCALALTAPSGCLWQGTKVAIGIRPTPPSMQRLQSHMACRQAKLVFIVQSVTLTNLPARGPG